MKDTKEEHETVPNVYPCRCIGDAVSRGYRLTEDRPGRSFRKDRHDALRHTTLFFHTILTSSGFTLVEHLVFSSFHFIDGKTFNFNERFSKEIQVMHLLSSFH